MQIVGHPPHVLTQPLSAQEAARFSTRAKGASPAVEIERYQFALKGQPVCIIGNGPSAAQYDLASIDCATIGLNQAWRLRKCAYYCAGDSGQFHAFERAHGAGSLPTFAPLFSTHAGPPHAIRIRSHPVTCYKRFSLDLAHEGIYLNNTIASFALQLACYMRAHPIYLIGIDCGGTHFYDDKPIDERKFSNQRETLGHHAGFLACERPALDVINLNMKTRSMAFPRMYFDDVFPLAQHTDADGHAHAPTIDRSQL